MSHPRRAPVQPLFLFLALLWMGFIAWVTTRPGSELPRVGRFTRFIFAPDKVIHFTLYAGLAALLWRALVPRDLFHLAALRRPTLSILAFIAVMAAFDEINQWANVSGRSGEVADYLADVLGAASVLALAGERRAALLQDALRRRKTQTEDLPWLGA